MAEKATLYLFTSPTCPHCPVARKMMEEIKNERDDFELIDMISGSQEAAHYAKEFSVLAVPTFIIQGPAYPDNIGLSGSQTKETINKYIDMALGKQKESREKESFIQKLKKKGKDGFKIGKLRIKF